MASVVLGVAGAVVGSFFGQPQLGYMIGSALGAALFPPHGADGPRISDLKVQGSQYGSMIPIVYNICRVSGQVIWATELVEHANEEDSGSGGGGVTTYTYTCSFAVSVCEGEKGIRKIWADGKKIYDVDATTQSYKATSLVFYTGTEDQLPDPTIEMHEGVGNVPGYRGQCYCVFTDLQLGKYGNRIPNLTFEVGPIAQNDTLFEELDPITTAMGGSTWPHSVEGTMVYVSSTDRVWMFTNNNFQNKPHMAPGYFAILDPNDDYSIQGYTYGETGQYRTATYGTPSPPATDSDRTYWFTAEGTDYYNDYLLIESGADTGDWAGKANYLAQYVSGAWEFTAPVTGMRVVDYASSLDVKEYNGSSWGTVTWSSYADNIIWFYNNAADWVAYSPVLNTVFTYSIQYGIMRRYDRTTGQCVQEKIWPEILWSGSTHTPYLSGDRYSFLLDEAGDIWCVGTNTKASPKITKISGVDLSILTETTMTGDVGPVGRATGNGKVFYVEGDSIINAPPRWRLRVFDTATSTITTIKSVDSSTKIPVSGLYATSNNTFHMLQPKDSWGVDNAIGVEVYDGTSLLLLGTYNLGNGALEGSYDPYQHLVWFQNPLTFGAGSPTDTQLQGFDPSTYEVVYSSDTYVTRNWYSPVALPGQVVAAEGDSTNAFWRYQWGAGTVDSIVHLGAIVRDISLRTRDLQDAQINVNELTDTVRGYALANQMAGRSAIEPLANGFFFDAVESSGVIKFVKRGANPVVTINGNTTVLENQQ